ncbi:hypothetical protein, partial [Limosilactobacillus reuteri]|uniref:hypothetical protein n=1 Tax=Limosilactobacillus reuteri TaxID=1598 RepID=UPI00207D5934
MKDKIEKSKDEAEKRILEGKIKTQQDFRTELLGTPSVLNLVPSAFNGSSAFATAAVFIICAFSLYSSWSILLSAKS